jgi:hypothetical protein
MKEGFLKRIFSGNFVFERIIEDNISLQKIFMKGFADFKNHSNKIISYTENGSYFLNQNEYFFEKNLYFIFNLKFLKILDSKKNTLHKVSLKELKHPSYFFSNTHKCSKDLYELNFYIEKNKIVMKYNIIGLSKNLNILTVLENIS